MNIRLLIVDDHPVIRQGLEGFLSLDPEIEIVGKAVNGLEGVEKARELKPDIVITNYSMPIMDGIEATRIIKQEMPTTRVIVLTHAAEAIVTTKALLAGADICLHKGVSSDQLLQAVKGNILKI